MNSKEKSLRRQLEVLLPHLTQRFDRDPPLKSTSIHPSFKVTDSIYEEQHSNFVSRLSTPANTPQMIRMRVPCTPVFTYPDPHTKVYEKEDFFVNPTALYLSRKPLDFKRKKKRTNLSEERVISFTPSLVEPNKKRPKQRPAQHSFSLSSGSDPLKELQKKITLKPKRNLQVEALKRIDKACCEMEGFPNVTPVVREAKKILDSYVKNVEWTSDVLSSYSAQESEVLKQLYILSDNSRNELNKDMAATAEEIKKGTMDPALRHRKRKLVT